MIRKLRLKFVAICMALVTAVLAGVFLSIYVSTQNRVEDLSRQVLHRVAADPAYSGEFGSMIRPEPGISIDGDRVPLPYFTVQVWGSQAYVTGGTYADLEDTDTLQAILDACLRQSGAEGVLPDYQLRYLRQSSGLVQKITFVDMSMEVTILRGIMEPYLVIALIALAVLLAVSVLLSHWAVRPVERAWKQQKQFLSDASHELKTPLTVILSNAELLGSEPMEERPARWADNIHSEARRMKILVEEMLTLARADSVTRPPVFSPVSLSELAAHCALAFEPVAFEAGKPLGYHLAEDLTVQGDEEKLRQLISVLLDNAIKYGEEGGVITMTLTRAERSARLTVANPGPPIPPEHLSRLFERFYRADASRGETSGFGLGLSIADCIAREHKAALTAESDARSTRFTLTIPLA